MTPSSMYVKLNDVSIVKIIICLNEGFLLINSGNKEENMDLFKGKGLKGKKFEGKSLLVSQ